MAEICEKQHLNRAQINFLGTFCTDSDDASDYCMTLSKMISPDVLAPQDCYKYLIGQLLDSDTHTPNGYSAVLQLIKSQPWQPFVFSSDPSTPSTLKTPSRRRSERKREEEREVALSRAPFGTGDFLEVIVTEAFRESASPQHKQSHLAALNLIITAWEEDTAKKKRKDANIYSFVQHEREYNSNGALIRDIFGAVTTYCLEEGEDDFKQDTERHSTSCLYYAACLAVRLLSLVLYTGRGEDDIHRFILPHIRDLCNPSQEQRMAHVSPSQQGGVVFWARHKIDVLHFILKNMKVSVQKLDFIHFLLKSDYQTSTDEYMGGKPKKKKKNQSLDDSILDDLQLTPTKSSLADFGKQSSEDIELTQGHTGTSLSQNSSDNTPVITSTSRDNESTLCTPPRTSQSQHAPHPLTLKPIPTSSTSTVDVDITALLSGDVAMLRTTALHNVVEIVSTLDSKRGTRRSGSKRGLSSFVDYDMFGILLYHCVNTTLEISEIQSHSQEEGLALPHKGPDRDLQQVMVLDLLGKDVAVSLQLLECIDTLLCKVYNTDGSISPLLLEYLKVRLGGEDAAAYAPPGGNGDGDTTEDEGLEQ